MQAYIINLSSVNNMRSFQFSTVFLFVKMVSILGWVKDGTVYIVSGL